jgi:hypothetical protein
MRTIAALRSRTTLSRPPARTEPVPGTSVLRLAELRFTRDPAQPGTVITLLDGISRRSSVRRRIRAAVDGMLADGTSES